jgi:hypothetical protein
VRSSVTEASCRSARLLRRFWDRRNLELLAIVPLKEHLCRPKCRAFIHLIDGSWDVAPITLAATVTESDGAFLRKSDQVPHGGSVTLITFRLIHGFSRKIPFVRYRTLLGAVLNWWARGVAKVRNFAEAERREQPSYPISGSEFSHSEFYHSEEKSDPINRYLMLADVALAAAREEQRRIKEKIRPHVERYRKLSGMMR